MAEASARGTMGAGCVEWDRVLHPLHAVDRYSVHVHWNGRSEWGGLPLSQCLRPERRQCQRVSATFHN